MKLEMNMQSSFDKFRNTTLDGGSAGRWVILINTHPTLKRQILLTDFSDSVYRQRQCGFKVQPDDYEVTAVEREPETILQRYQRLKQEVGDHVI